METPIGRCSLCSGTVVKETGAWLGTQPPVARCRACGATEAPPDRVIQMEKPSATRPMPKQALENDYNEALQQFRDKNGRALQDAIGKQLMAQKPCPHCGPIPMGGGLSQFIGQNSIVG